MIDYRILAHVSCVALLGCATTTPWEEASIAAAMADLGSTAAAISDGCAEGNPLWTLGGEDLETTLAMGALLHAAHYAVVKYAVRDLEPAQAEKVWRWTFSIKLAAPAWNGYQLGSGACQ